MWNERQLLAIRLALDDQRAHLARRAAGLAERIAADPAAAAEILAADVDHAAAEFQAAFERRSAALASKSRPRPVR